MDLQHTKTILRTTLLLSVILLLSVSSVSWARACPGYEKYRVTEYEMTPEYLSSRPSANDLGRGLSAVGDFDGDGHVDEAFFIKKDDKYFLVVCLVKGSRLVKLLELKRHPYLDEDGGDSVWVVPVGIYVSSCAKGSGCALPDPFEEELAHEGIRFDFWNTSRIFFWADGTFKVLWQ